MYRNKEINSLYQHVTPWGSVYKDLIVIRFETEHYTRKWFPKGYTFYIGLYIELLYGSSKLCPKFWKMIYDFLGFWIYLIFSIEVI